MALKNIEPKVKEILTRYPDTRDNDNYLMCFYISEFYPEYKNKTYIDCITDRNFPDFSSVTRIRRKLQERHEELRGMRWICRNTDIKEEFIEYAMCDKMHPGI